MKITYTFKQKKKLPKFKLKAKAKWRRADGLGRLNFQFPLDSSDSVTELLHVYILSRRDGGKTVPFIHPKE
jgi:hypothetical protein